MAEDLDAVLHATLLGDAMQNVAVAALVADENGQYIAVNEAACALTGYSRRALTGFRAGELAADDSSRQIYENVMQGRKLRGRKRVRRKDGNVVDCRYWALPTTVAKLPYFILLLWLTRPREILSPAA
jgi:PAS domain S-box-containing protein